MTALRCKGDGITLKSRYSGMENKKKQIAKPV